MSLLSVVLPCFRPPKHWVNIIVVHYTELSALLSAAPELIIVCDGDTELSPTDVATLRAHLPNLKWVDYPTNRGKGFALRQGVSQATGAHTIYTDIDFPYGVDGILNVYKTLQEGANLVAGVKEENYYKNVPWVRRVISKSFRFFIRHFFSMPITDTQCGLKGFDSKGKELFEATSIDRYLFDLEFIYLASRNKYLKCVSVPAKLRAGIVFSSMDMRILLGEATNFLKILWRKS